MDFDYKVDLFWLSIYETRNHDMFILYSSSYDTGESYKLIDDINKIYSNNAEWLFEDMMTNFTIADEYNKTIANKAFLNYFNRRENDLIDFYDFSEEVEVSPDLHLIADFYYDSSVVDFKIDWESLEIENAIFFLDWFNVIFKYCAENGVELREKDYRKIMPDKIHIEF